MAGVWLGSLWKAQATSTFSVALHHTLNKVPSHCGGKLCSRGLKKQGWVSDRKAGGRQCTGTSLNWWACTYDVRIIFRFFDPFPSCLRSELIYLCHEIHATSPTLSDFQWPLPPQARTSYIYGSPLSGVADDDRQLQCSDVHRKVIVGVLFLGISRHA